jgi:flagellar motor switch protein FliN/FliY
MNQMMGSSATSLSSMINKKVDISPPEADLVDMAGEIDTSKVSGFMGNDFVRVTFKMTIGDLVDSTIMQLYPIDFAKDLYKMFNGSEEEKSAPPQPATPKPESKPQPQPIPEPQPQAMNPNMMGQQPMMQGMNPNMMGQQPMMQGMYPMQGQPMMMGMQQPDVNVQNVQFQPFTPMINPITQQENIDLIMDVPLEVSVVLGRTRKSIKEILEFAPGTIIELDKLAGEPIDVMVNQKLVAKGEVVVIEESFGIRITEIIKQNI